MLQVLPLCYLHLAATRKTPRGTNRGSVTSCNVVVASPSCAPGKVREHIDLNQELVRQTKLDGAKRDTQCASVERPCTPTRRNSPPD